MYRISNLTVTRKVQTNSIQSKKIINKGRGCGSRLVRPHANSCNTQRAACCSTQKRACCSAHQPVMKCCRVQQAICTIMHPSCW
ncbi:hypothetical protein AQUCO_01500398v1 [Aquilegia coerulea]|uniref:Uncharacterized protein n=1 Tax=Aquilegia coerulea TaxID=218851 RepID=A0A2G5DTH1_AQUCA|nr:hypothetical protein AQUCO_01500398v1 [Aquilegia coerulea]